MRPACRRTSILGMRLALHRTIFPRSTYRVSTRQERQRPPQHQVEQPGREQEMRPPPRSFLEGYQGSGKLNGRVALSTDNPQPLAHKLPACCKENQNAATRPKNV